MPVDLEAIARRSQCELTSLKAALPLIEQGFSPPFLARYRRDELGGLAEQPMWALYRAVREEAWVKNRREDLLKRLEQIPQADPALGRAIRSASSKRVIDRLGRRVRHEVQEASSPATRVALRVLNPEKNDPRELPLLLQALQLTPEAVDDAAIDQALVQRLAGHPQLQATAVRWLINNAKIRIVSVKDIHAEADDDAHSGATAGASAAEPTTGSSSVIVVQDTGLSDVGEHWPTPDTLDTTPAADPVSAEPTAVDSAPAASDDSNSDAASGAEVVSGEVSNDAAPQDIAAASGDAEHAVPAATSEPTSGEPAAATPAKANESKAGVGKAGKGKAKSKPKLIKPAKKISPRQRRRRWLVSVLQPLQGKEIPAQKLTAFQTLMLGRGLRSGVVQCQFVYDANKLTEQLYRAAAGLNEAFGERLKQLTIANNAAIREAAEAVWWDELLESAASRLVSVAADHLDAQMNREGVEAKVVLSIDAIGPRTAAMAIVAADGRLLHTEDLACQLTAATRSTAVTRLGELIHRFGVDLIVISNGPVRRGCLVILHELVDQSSPGSIRWTIADRSGADVYAGSEIGNREMRVTPRRFRAAAWLAFSVLRPSQAMTKVDPLRLRLGCFQMELAEDALWPALRDVMTSGVSRGGVDVNAAPVDWLRQLPGMSGEIAHVIDSRRRSSLFTKRSEVMDLGQWPDTASARQAIAFLRVFGSEESLDGTLIHPEDYALAKKLAGALKLELPPSTPPGYQTPKFDEPAPPIDAAHADASGAASAEDSEETDVEDDSHFAAELLADESLSVDSIAGDEAGLESEPSSEEVAGEPAVAPELAETVDTDQVEAAATDHSETTDPVAVSTPPADRPAPVEVQIAPAFRQAKPEDAQINKCIKEWQIGARRARQLVDALCDPFGEESSAGNAAAHAVMSKVPKLTDLAVGDQVIGVVVGVTEFGAFVELSPECSGLIHVSRVADRFVEDLHEAVQVGDVLTAWVTNIDLKRRRVGLSAISPQRESELEQQRQQRREESRFQGRPGRGGQRHGGGQQQGSHAGGNRGDSRGGQGQPARRDDAARSGAVGAQASRGAQAQGNRAGAAGRGGQESAGRYRSEGGRGEGNRGDQRGGQRPNQGGQRGGKFGGRKRYEDHDEDTPRSYSTKVQRNDVPAAPISEAMAKGEEPLRSFGDLMQFFKKAAPEPVEVPKTIKPAVAETDDVAPAVAPEIASEASPAASGEEA